MIEASPSRCTPEQWTAEQAARAMGVVDEADGAALGVEGAAVGESGDVRAVGREEPKARRMRWAAGGTALAVVAVAAWWSGAGNRNSREILAHAGADGALIAGERTPNSGPGDFNSSNGSSHMKIQTTAAAALLGAAAGAFQAQAGDAVQWRVEDGGNGHWYAARTDQQILNWTQAKLDAEMAGGHLATVTSVEESEFIWSRLASDLSTWRHVGNWSGAALGGYRDSFGWKWVTGEAWGYSNWGTCYNQQGEERLAFGCETYGNAWNDITDVDSNIGGSILEWSADCNNDNIVDYGQILNGTLPDTNTNNIPDCCEPGNSCCLGDIYVNHIIDGGDLGVLLSEWGVVTPTTNSDLNRDGFVNGADLGMLLANWGPCGA
jgi:hypothetical protein